MSECTKAQQLLEKVELLENAAKRGIELNKDRAPGIPPEKTISLEQCEWTLKSCETFRGFIRDTFGDEVAVEEVTASRIAGCVALQIKLTQGCGQTKSEPCRRHI